MARFVSQAYTQWSAGVYSPASCGTTSRDLTQRLSAAQRSATRRTRTASGRMVEFGWTLGAPVTRMPLLVGRTRWS